MSRGSVFAAVFAGMFAAHQVADYWVQTDSQAQGKGLHGPEGRRACLAHVASYTAVSALSVIALDRVLGLRLNLRSVVVPQVISAGSHYAADRREHGVMFRLGRRIGKGDFLDRGGAALLDQAWHIGFLGVAAAATAVLAFPHEPKKE